MTDELHLDVANKNTDTASGVASATDKTSMAHRWMMTTVQASQSPLNANQRTSISAMIAYISNKSGQSEFRLERKLSDRFNVPNPKCLPANDFDEAIRYLADIISM